MNAIKKIIAEMEAAIKDSEDYRDFEAPPVTWMNLVIWRDTLKAYISVND